MSRQLAPPDAGVTKAASWAAMRVLSVVAAMGLFVTAIVHVLTWTGRRCETVEWPLRVSAFCMLGIAILAIRKGSTVGSDWRTMLGATPKGVVAALIVVYLYWAGSLLFFVVFGYRSEVSACRDLTARLLAPWAFAAASLDALARKANRPPSSDSDGRSI